jgi:hypothetical protein
MIEGTSSSILLLIAIAMPSSAALIIRSIASTLVGSGSFCLLFYLHFQLRGGMEEFDPLI